MRVEKWCQVGWNVLVGSVVLLALGCGGEDAVAPTSGSLEVTTTTTGPDPDVDGYTVSIDGGAEVAVGTDATLRRDDLGAGEHSVRLSSVSENCTVEAPNPRTVTVTAGEVTPVAFAVSCTALPPTTGTLTITTITTGSSLDPDGYTASVDGGGERPIEINASLTISPLVTGTHTVELGGLAPNCEVVGDNPRTVAITVGAATNTTFTITCALAQGTKILFESDRDGRPDVFVINTDGSLLMNLTLGARQEGQWYAIEPQWSPNGRKIVFVGYGPDTVSDREPIPTRIFVMNADGSNLTNLLDTPTIDLKGSPRWSPDGRKIAFHGGAGIHVMNADGSAVTFLARGGNPTWSPDGTRIAFEGNGGIFVMNADGSAQSALSNGLYINPSWSPDGRKIAFISSNLGQQESDIENLWVMNADGSSAISPTNFSSPDGPNVRIQGYSWAPDGNKIAFGKIAFDRFEAGFSSDIYAVRTDGTGLTNLTNGSAQVYAPRWSPDGTHILFSARIGSDPDVISDLFIMSADGTAVTNLTNAPGRYGGAEWQP